MTNWLRRLREAFAPAPRIGDADWNALLARSALFDRLGADERVALRALCERFLARKTFSAAGGHVLNDAECLAIAALACLPVLHLGFDHLAGWREVIVYPGEFRVRREHHDEHSGVVTEGDDELIGEAWEHGPVILSWADVATDLERPFDGFNVVAHEIAHKLDALDGAMNGTPRLPPSIARRDWVEAMQSAYDALLRAVERGRETAIDPYAAESADEYFAVVSELHFSDPATLAREAPAVAALLARFYGARAPETSVAASRSDR
ncbi:M90 family metallopeptidase [Dokdonella sp.]|uniref:M90 family metallopeptidase n=1 Tax=Dokdonella sp. TaxID=2291710 RepID=UPI001B28D544|nr:M90 family metallopeptidase [Dokdonella sp.]MBO9661420.1 zinc-dependent peptidase [Dokdonella sp.]